jgi:hypothetical protein
MRLFVYSIYDVVPAVHNRPFVSINDGSAVRDFEHACLDNPHMRDLELKRIGLFDDVTGVLVPETPVVISRGLEVYNRLQNQLPEYTDEDGEEVPAMLKEQAE